MDQSKERQARRAPMSRHALLAAGAMGLIGGSCILVYHPGDYTTGTGGGGHGGTGSGATGSTTTSGTGTGSTTSDAGSQGLRVCNAVPDGGSGDCLALKFVRWIGQPSKIATSEIAGVALSDAHIGVVGNFQGTVTASFDGLDHTITSTGALAAASGFLELFDRSGAPVAIATTTGRGKMFAAAPLDASTWIATGADAPSSAYGDSLVVAELATGSATFSSTAHIHSAPSLLGTRGTALALGEGGIVYTFGVLQGNTNSTAALCEGATESGWTWPPTTALLAGSFATAQGIVTCGGSEIYPTTGDLSVTSVTSVPSAESLVTSGWFEGAPPKNLGLPTAGFTGRSGFVLGWPTMPGGNVWAAGFLSSGAGSSVTITSTTFAAPYVYVSGWFHGALAWQDVSTSADRKEDADGQEDAFLARIRIPAEDAGGIGVDKLWHFHTGPNANCRATAVAASPDGQALYVAGTANAPLNPRVDGVVDRSVCGADGGIFVLKLAVDDEGVVTELAQCFGPSTQGSFDVRLAVDAQDLVLAGTRVSAIDFGNGPTNPGKPAGFVAVFARP